MKKLPVKLGFRVLHSSLPDSNDTVLQESEFSSNEIGSRGLAGRAVEEASSWQASRPYSDTESYNPIGVLSEFWFSRGELRDPEEQTLCSFTPSPE